jgi:hypothetical protein
MKGRPFADSEPIETWTEEALQSRNLDQGLMEATIVCFIVFYILASIEKRSVVSSNTAAASHVRSRIVMVTQSCLSHNNRSCVLGASEAALLKVADPRPCFPSSSSL